MELNPSHISCTQERETTITNFFSSQTLPRAMESLPCNPRWGCCHFCSVVPMSTEPMQGPAPSHLPSPAAAPTSRHIPFVFAFPGSPLIELSRSISVAAAAVIRRLCGRAGTGLGPRSGTRPLRDPARSGIGSCHSKPAPRNPFRRFPLKLIEQL